jgi:hypothetical protein
MGKHNRPRRVRRTIEEIEAEAVRNQADKMLRQLGVIKDLKEGNDKYGQAADASDDRA